MDSLRIDDFRNILYKLHTVLNCNTIINDEYIFGKDFDLEQVKIIEKDLMEIIELVPIDYFEGDELFLDIIDEIDNYNVKYNVNTSGNWIKGRINFTGKRNEAIKKIIEEYILNGYRLILEY